MESSGCICIDFRSVTHQLTRLYDREMAPAGMTVTQFSQLNTIRELGAPTLNELSEALGLDRSTLGRNVRVLEKSGFVSMTAGRDARTRVIRMTDAGASAFRHAARLWHGVQTQLADAVGEDPLEAIHDLLARVNHACATYSTNTANPGAIQP